MGSIQLADRRAAAEGNQSMTSIAEMARMEAEEAEAEQEAAEAAEQEGADQETSDQPEVIVEDTATTPTVDLAEREKKLRSEDTRHENALKKIHGDHFADMAFCPLCLGQGFLEPIPAGNQPDEVWEAITALSGRLQGSAFRHPDELVPCQRCDGYGQVATGAKNDHNAIILCDTCNGRGYFNLDDATHRAKLGIVPPPPELPSFNIPAFNVTPPTPAGETLSPPSGWHAAGSPGADQWGRWPGHPRFGISLDANGGIW